MVIKKIFLSVVTIWGILSFCCVFGMKAEREIVIPEGLPFTVDFMCTVAQYSDLCSASRLLLCTCKTLSDRYNKGIPKDIAVQFVDTYDGITKEDLQKIQFGMDRFLWENPSFCTKLTIDEHLSALVHCAQKQNETLFKHIMQHENAECTKHRHTVLPKYAYNDLQANMQAYKALYRNGNRINFLYFFASVSNNNLYAVKLFIKNNIDLGVLNKEGMAALHIAATEGHLDMMKLLIDSGANVEQKTACYHWRPLHCAVIGGKEDAIQFLLEYGNASIHARGQYKQTLLHVAAFKGFNALVQLFIDKGVDMHAIETSLGGTALHQALYHCHPDSAIVLINAGADYMVKDRVEKTALSLAKSKIADDGYAQVVQLILSKEKEEQKKLKEQEKSQEEEPCIIS